MKIVLASESPFRRPALDMLDLAYEICPSEIDEKVISDSNPAILTEQRDAVVSKGNRIYEKPRSMEEAA